MQKNKSILFTVIITLISAAVLVFVILNHTDAQTGQSTSDTAKIISLAASALCIISAATVFFTKNEYRVSFPKGSAHSKVFLILLAAAFIIHSCGLVFEKPPTKLAMITALLGGISVFFFAYIAFSSNIKRDTVYYLAIGPFAFLTLRIIWIFNVFSRNISLYTYKYEIIGMCCLLLFLLMYVKFAYNGASAKKALFFGLTAFAFLTIYSLSSIILGLSGRVFFTNNAPMYSIYGDFLIGIGTLYFCTTATSPAEAKHVITEE